MTQDIISDEKIDSTLDLWREGYLFISNRREALNTDIFSTRLFLHDTLCIGGPESAKLFYDNDHFKRHGVAPSLIQKTLTGEDGVQSLDDEAHQNRKAMFMSMMTSERLTAWGQIFVTEWKNSLYRWENMHRVQLFEEVQEILCKSACVWAGVPLDEKEAKTRASQMGEMIKGFGSIGLMQLKGRIARKQTEEWAESIIHQVRQHKLAHKEGTALAIIAWHKDEKGELLPTEVAAVELLNIIRPIVALATYISFMAVALQHHPESYRKLSENRKHYDRWFVQEVRRYYPFTPFIGALVRDDFEWNGHHFAKDQRVLLDVYGILHDLRLWEEPQSFMPERFSQGEPDHLFTFIPSGGGDYEQHHRCAGEWLTVQTMQQALDLLVHGMDYSVPAQDFNFSLSTIPTMPASGFIMQDVREKGEPVKLIYNGFMKNYAVSS